METALSISRILFGLIYLMKMSSSINARGLVWAHRKPPLFPLLLLLNLAGTILVIMGLFTLPALLVVLVSNLILFRYASLFGMDDTLFHSFLFYLLLADPSRAFSIDSLIHFPSGRLLGPNYLPEVALFFIFGAIFLSAGVRKLQSPLWRKGLGVYYFFLMPLHRRIEIPWITRHPHLLKPFNYLILFMQCGFLPLSLIHLFPLGFFAVFFFMGFAFSLCTLFVFTWLGEIIFTALIPLLSLTILQPQASLISFTEQGLSNQHSPQTQILTALLFFCIFCCFWSGLVSHLHPVFSRKILAQLHEFFRTVARLSFGFLPVDLFGERHIQGPVIYRVFEKKPQGMKEIFTLFRENCLSGPHRELKPTFLEVTQYKVSEACMEMDAFGCIKNPEREKFIFALARFIAKEKSPQAHCLHFKIFQLIPPPLSHGDPQWYLKQSWTDAFDVHFEGGKERLVVLNRPLLKGPTGRDMERISFFYDSSK